MALEIRMNPAPISSDDCSPSWSRRSMPRWAASTPRLPTAITAPHRRHRRASSARSLRGLRHHVSDAKKRGKGGWIDGKVGEIMAKLEPELPRTLRLEDQGRFAIGYYHERASRRSRKDETDPSEEEASQ